MSTAYPPNRREPTWDVALRAHDVQLLTVSVFRSPAGDAIEIEGSFEVLKENLGFGRYSATDRSMRFPRTLRLPVGRVQINDASGSLSWWMVVQDGEATWVTKETGVPNIAHDASVQLIRTMDGRVSLRQPG